MEFISDDYQHPYLKHRNILNPYTSAYAHPDYLGAETDFIRDDDPSCPPDDEESGPTMKSIMGGAGEDEIDDYPSSYQNRYREDDEELSSYNSGSQADFGIPRRGEEEYPARDEQYPEPQGTQRKFHDDYNPKTDGKRGASNLEDKLTSRLDQLKSVFKKRFHRFSDFCSWNCFFGLLFVVGVLLVFLDHYGSAYVRMMNMQKFFFFIMGVLTTTVAVVVVCVVVAFTSCYGDGF